MEDLAPLNLDVEATCRRNNRARRRRQLQEGLADQGDRGIPPSESSSFTINLEEPVVSTFEATIMPEDRPSRVTLEGHSSSSTPQFFTSIAQPDVEAVNISYPHSLIQAS